MSDTDTGNATTQKMYEIATQPIFVDRSQDQEQEVSWEVSDGQETPLPPPLDEVKEESLPVEEPQEGPLDEEGEQEPETESIEEEETEREKKKKKNRLSEKNRIAQLIREKKQAQAVAHDVLTRNQYLEAKIAQKEKEASTNHENYLTSQKEQIKKYLTDAIEEGDPAKITEANDLLAQYNSEILWHKKQNNLQPKEQIPQYPDPNSYQEPAEVPFDETGRAWMEKNTWANPDSTDFDEEMYQDADNYSIRLARKYKLEGRGSEIGTDDFFNEITDYVKNSYDIVNTNPLPSKPQTRDRMQMKTDKSPPVGPVNRQAPQGSDAPRKSGDITLTAEQRETAHSLRGFVRDPKTGQKVTDNKTLEDIYKRNLMRGTA